MSTKTITIIDGDLLDVTEGIVAHQVNCHGVLGGLAATLTEAYPRVLTKYQSLCASVPPETLLGHAQLVISATPEHPALMVANLFGQLLPGPDTDYLAVRSAVRRLAEVCLFVGLDDAPLHVPYLMGCGIGGGDWDTYSTILCDQWPGEVIAHRLPPIHTDWQERLR